jgi:hypothetical protein
MYSPAQAETQLHANAEHLFQGGYAGRHGNTSALIFQGGPLVEEDEK